MIKFHTYNFHDKEPDFQDKFYTINPKDNNEGSAGIDITDNLENGIIESGNGCFINTNWVPIEVPKPKVQTNVFDVSAYILKNIGTVTTVKLQKLVYYCQAWSLVWDDKKLFDEQIEAWVNGPVVKDLYNYHKGFYEISNVSIGNPDKLLPYQKATIDSVLSFYKDKSTSWLVELTHHEAPWQGARKGLQSLERGKKVISLESMLEYYSSL